MINVMKSVRYIIKMSFFRNRLAFLNILRGYYRNFRQKFVKISAGHLVCLSPEKKSDHEGARTLNLPIRSRTPYPLGHAAYQM